MMPSTTPNHTMTRRRNQSGGVLPRSVVIIAIIVITQILVVVSAFSPPSSSFTSSRRHGNLPRQVQQSSSSVPSSKVILHSSSSSDTTENPLVSLFSSITKKKSKSTPVPVIPGIGEDGCKVPSPSGINTWSDTAQIGVFLSYFVVLAIGTVGLEPLLDILATNIGPIGFSTRYIQPLTIGLVYAVAGITHFTVSSEYENIMPYKGAWGGLWQLPGSSKFHVQWTGVAELLGGLGLLVGGLYNIIQPVYIDCPNIITNAGILSDSAAGLFLLTIAVTPANIFMYTHGARLPMSEPQIGVEFHYTRAVLQIILLSLLFQMGGGSFDIDAFH